MENQISLNTATVKKRKKIKVGEIILLAVLFIIALIQIYPLIWMFLFSLKDNGEIFSTNPIGLPHVWRWEHYKSALLEGGLGRYFLNSILYTGLTVVISGILSSMAAYALTRMKWALRGVTFVIFTIGIMIPIHAVLLPLYIVIDKLNIGGYASLLIPYIATSIPLSILILSSFYRSIPRDIEEAAFIDGCSIYTTFFKIILPIIKPALATVSIFTFLGTWNELIFANTFVNSSVYRTLTVGIMTFSGQYTTEWGLIGAGMVLATLPTVIIYIFLSDQVQDSLVAGAIKG